MKRAWALPEGRLAALLQARGVAVGATSPLAALPDAPDGSPSVPRPAKGLLAALEHVARPRLEMGLLLSPPHGLDVLWFYLGEGDEGDALVGHVVDVGRRHCLAWSSEAEILAQWRACLDLEAPVAGVGRALDLSRKGFQTLLALIDANREWTLQSLLDRLPQPHRVFTGERLVSSFRLTLRSDDPRWLGTVARLVAPFDFSLPTEDCLAGLAELGRVGLVEETGEGWVLTPEMHLMATVMAAPVAYAALHGRLEGGGRRHLAAVRGLGSLWWLGFRDEGVRLETVEGATVEARVGEALRLWRRDSAGRPTRRARKVGATLPPCTRCGAPLAADARFCTRCGLPTEPGKPPVRLCTSCGAPRKGRNRFCTACGKPFG